MEVQVPGITSTWGFSRTDPLIGPHTFTISVQEQGVELDYYTEHSPLILTPLLYSNYTFPTCVLI